jgi:hypothetical protein
VLDRRDHQDFLTDDIEGEFKQASICMRRVVSSSKVRRLV